MKPLEGIKVLDLTRALAGPFCTLMLGDYGADVIKIEIPGSGDDTRHWGPPFIRSSEGEESAYFLSINRNKRSLTLNFKEEQARRIFLELATDADIIVENFTPGVMDRFGLGYETVKSYQSKSHLRLDLRVRSRRAIPEPPGLRPDNAGDQRTHEPDRRTGRRTAKSRHRRIRHRGGHVDGFRGNGRGPPPQRAGRGPVHRHIHA